MFRSYNDCPFTRGAVNKANKFNILPTYLIESYKLDITRLSAQVVTGVGFIGGGAIVYSNDKVSGITTAATLWITAAIGLAIGYGFVFLSIAAFLIVVITLIVMKILERKVITMVRNKKATKSNLTKEEQKWKIIKDTYLI